MHLVVPAAPNGIRLTLERLARQYDFESTVAAEVGSIPIQLALAADSFEPMRVVDSYDAVADAIASGRMQASQIVSPAIERKLVMTALGCRPRSFAVREVSRIVAELARELLADAEQISPIARVMRPMNSKRAVSLLILHEDALVSAGIEAILMREPSLKVATAPPGAAHRLRPCRGSRRSRYVANT